MKNDLNTQATLSYTMSHKMFQKPPKDIRIRKATRKGKARMQNFIGKFIHSSNLDQSNMSQDVSNSMPKGKRYNSAVKPRSKKKIFESNSQTIVLEL